MPVVARFLTDDELRKSLGRDVLHGLTSTPKQLPSKWFYDEYGSELFDEITELEEYYPTRREREILAERAEEIAALARVGTVLELGAGAAEKTRLILDAVRPQIYMPVDVSGSYLAAAAGRLASDYPNTEVRAVVADYDKHLHLLPRTGSTLFAFLGSTIGNMTPTERISFLGGLRANMTEDDCLLLGVDLVKDSERLVRAYDDAKGVTAEFNRNVLRVINEGLSADFDPRGFEHVAAWDAHHEWMEMRLRAASRQRVTIRDLGITVTFAEGEEMRTEISAKFRRERLVDELGLAGLGLAQWWTDRAADFALCLIQPAEARSAVDEAYPRG